ncbi:MAG: hypothetical protein MN733_10465, partial [Nitrososphaera sp.]|nr:hypothetical protein [Nitrososphaera sp.]
EPKAVFPMGGASTTLAGRGAEVNNYSALTILHISGYNPKPMCPHGYALEVIDHCDDCRRNRQCPNCNGTNIKAWSVFMDGTGDYVCFDCRHKWSTRGK